MRLSPDISDNIAKTVKKEPMDSEYELESRELWWEYYQFLKNLWFRA